ncbi:hypothetical protein H2201_001830 [Coniosporium apollinis]|uniref:Uncharacterized protein n=1 Tax=Coniosporium apollinis TaxID=61459 RepID=A0ABQ9P099_9PEZI|nr:hypothetical protein H2201_001830 [Coniosporium apollinis]
MCHRTEYAFTGCEHVIVVQTKCPDKENTDDCYMKMYSKMIKEKGRCGSCEEDAQRSEDEAEEQDKLLMDLLIGSIISPGSHRTEE